ncbi:MAG: hypothetical protein IJT97_03300 [Bacteroidaceae bacterium]|nr:hypothetical protein [Bacteroidaceae bacterium]
MAKKKTKKNVTGQQPLSPERFLREKARGLEIGKCYVSRDMTLYGEGHVVVSRLHKGGKVSAAFYLIDIYCVGVKDSFYKLRMDDYEFESIVERLSIENIQECSYEEAHNWVYGSVAFAEEAGIQPDKSFNLTQYMLKEDTDEVPLLEFEFGKNGKHFLVARSNLEASRYLPTMKKHLGDDFKVMIETGGNHWGDEDEGDEDDDEYEDFEDSPLFKTYGPDIKYAYQHPAYPQVLEVENQWIVPELCDPKNAISLDDKLIDRLLALPHDSLRRDLEQLILFHIGLTCHNLPDEDTENEFNGVIGTATMLLAEVGNENSSLDVVLEVLRQSPDFYDYHINDAGEDVFTPTLYKLGQHRLNKLMDFAKEEGLHTYGKYQVFPAVAQIAIQQPERRAEVIKWFREYLRFVTQALPEARSLDSTVAGLMVCDLVAIRAEELLEEIHALFDTGLVDLGCCGKFQSVERDILHPRYPYTNTIKLDIHERFAQMRRLFEH